MTLREAIEQYILWRQAHGAKFTCEGDVLRRLLRYADGDAACDAVTKAQVLAFLAGKGPLTRYRENKYCALGGFWRYAISRDLASRSPLPDNEPRPPARRPPHIYSRDELKRLFDPATITVCRRRAWQLDAATFRTLLVLLYGAGLRYGEATRLTLADVYLQDSVLTVRATKFYKSRLVPIGLHLAEVLKAYMPLRQRGSSPQDDRSFLLANRDGTALAKNTVQQAFDGLRRTVGISGRPGGREVPRLHDLRHSFAVHRLTAWYREGCDVQRLLPVLSAYLGHADLEGTKVYLTMTPELLQQASLRFERYARGGSDV